MSTRKLGGIPPRLTGQPSRLGASDRDGKSRDKHRAALKPWRAWYGTARWAQLRQAAFVRDRFTCQRSGILLMGKHPAPDSPVANHKVRHNGDPELFWNLDNIETIAKAVHDAEVQAEEAKQIGGVWY